MPAGYSKEFLIDAFVSRYVELGEEVCARSRALAENYYDLVGKDQFRVSASLDADAIKVYKQSLASKK